MSPKDRLAQPRMSLRQKIILIISGLFAAVILLEIGLRLGGLIFLSLQEHRNKAGILKKDTYRILCLGESTTACGDLDSYPAQLEEVLNQRNLGIKFKVINKGSVAINTSDIRAHLEENIQNYQPDMVITMMGINDGQIKYYEGIPDAGTPVFQNFRTYRLAEMLWRQIIDKYSEASPKSNFKPNKALDEMPTGLSPGNGRADADTGPGRKEQEEYRWTEEKLKRAIELDPGNDKLYVMLGKFYSEEIKHSQAEAAYRKALRLNPRNDEAYVWLGWSYKEQGRHAAGEEFFKKAEEINPRNSLAHIGLGFAYKDRQDYAAAEAAFKHAIELSPANPISYIWLGNVYEKQGKYAQTQETYKKAIELYPKNQDSRNDKLYGELAMLYQKIGRHKEAEEYYKKADKVRLEYYNPITRDNYRNIKASLDKNGIKLVCVQYPVRSIDSLKAMFKGQGGVIFVDNERIFKAALKKDGYKEYFIDTFGGEFGHCTRKGNRLLAENIANTVSQNIFTK